MQVFYRLKKAASWLMLGLALLAGVVPSTLAGVDGGHLGDFVDTVSVHSHTGNDLNTHHTDANPLLYSADHSDTFCTDHCCSDACSAALSTHDPYILSLQNPVIGFISDPAELSPTEELFIPPKLA